MNELQLTTLVAAGSTVAAVYYYIMAKKADKALDNLATWISRSGLAAECMEWLIETGKKK